MTRDFFPFVEEEAKKPHNSFTGDSEVSYPARIAVYDDPAVTPRVVVLEPTNVRDFLSSLTETVTKLSHEQGGTIPFTIIREIVENYIHAEFIEPTITILDHGNTIRFCDQGPGIKEKEKALEFGTTSATDSMKQYIRGVGSGLPIAQQYMIDKGGSLSIQDNISSGTIVTISTHPAEENSLPITPRDTQHLYQDIEKPAEYTNEVATPQQIPAFQAQQVIAPVPYPATYGQYNQTALIPQYQPIPVSIPPQSVSVAPTLATTPTTTPTTDIHITNRGRQILSLFSTYTEIGGKELVGLFGGSQPTWSRELKLLDNSGLTHKTGQKRQLTAAGKAYLQSLTK
ncbi:ATP-binding protein [Atopobium fossor]|uniref:ATP-binding protein n=1 Tax=Atopobium fossor TaxID=39487 RepID=UPI00040F3200|nr:ATP-binding protein [Atopobium fossor]